MLVERIYTLGSQLSEPYYTNVSAIFGCLDGGPGGSEESLAMA